MNHFATKQLGNAVFISETIENDEELLFCGTPLTEFCAESPGQSLLNHSSLSKHTPWWIEF